MTYETFLFGDEDTPHLYDCSPDIRHIKGKMVKTIMDGGVVYSRGCGDFKYAFHRLDGPAVIDFYNECIDFYISDGSYFKTEVYCRAAGMSGEETLMWVLRFGDRLPKTIDGFYGENWESIPVDQF